MAKKRTRAVAVRRSYFARRRSGGGSRFGSGKISAALLAGFGVSLYNAYMPPDGSAGAPVSVNQYLQRLMLYYTGFAPWLPAGQKWQPAYMRFGLVPLVTGALVHYIANMTGVNRAVARLTRSIPVQI